MGLSNGLSKRGTTSDAPPRVPSGSLSAAEQDVLVALVGGATNREIAARRCVSERTVANQVASILRKVGVTSRVELIRRFAAA